MGKGKQALGTDKRKAVALGKQGLEAISDRWKAGKEPSASRERGVRIQGQV